MFFIPPLDSLPTSFLLPHCLIYRLVLQIVECKHSASTPHFDRKTANAASSNSRRIMAVLDSVPGLEVLVCVEGKPLPEYDDEDQEREPEPANHVCKYVESISDREYTINIRFNVPFTMNCPSLVVYIKIDGILMNSPVILKRDYPGAFRGEELLFSFARVVKGKAVDVPGRDNVEQIQNFRFSKIQTSQSLQGSSSTTF